MAAPAPARNNRIRRRSTYTGKDITMPFINIQVTREGVTAEQKAQLIKGATELLQTVLNKDPQTTFVIIDEVDTDNWGVGGEQVTARRIREKAARSA
jgi:4-oxalocrotonate tautomerase